MSEQRNEEKMGARWQEVLIRRRRVIAAAALVCAFSAVIFNYLLPKTYQSGMVVRIGRVAYPTRENQLTQVFYEKLDTAETLQDMVKSEPFLASVIQRLDLDMTPTALAKKIKVKINLDIKGDQTDNRQVVIQAKAGTPKGTVEILEAIAALIVERHAGRFDQAMKMHFEYEAELKGQVKKVEAELEEMKASFRKLQGNPGVSVPAVLLLQGAIHDREERLTDLKRELNTEASVAHTRLKSENTTVEVHPFLPDTPKGLSPAMMGVLGLLAGAAAAGVYFVFREAGWDA